MNTRSFLIAAVASATVVVSSAQAQPARSVWDGVYTADQAARGKAQMTTNCVRCHGDSLQGLDVAPTLVGGSFLSNWSGQTVGDLVERIRTTMPADDPGKIGAAQAADIVSYILSVNQMPAGAAELPRDAQVQKTIRIDALKPTAMNTVPAGKAAATTAANTATKTGTTTAVAAKPTSVAVKPVAVKTAAKPAAKSTVKVATAKATTVKKKSP